MLQHNTGRWIRFASTALLALLICCRNPAAGRDPDVPQDTSVQIAEKSHAGAITLYAELNHCTEATLTLTLTLTNMSASAESPLTVDAKGRQSLELLTVRPIDPHESWHYHYHYDWLRGGRCDVKASTFVYALPYRGGKHRVLQGYQSTFSHTKGSNDEYAIDWQMPSGTTVLAARGGTVVALRQESGEGGEGEHFINAANYLVIKHDDGTFAEYLHLQEQGGLVKLGDRVQRGQPVARSGNTGYSTEPHLHFALFGNIDGKIRRTIPVKFRLKDGTIAQLQEGESY
jgi:murein DD-endopeptidase MepM/ murein hydrolase activator NlpD